MTEWLEHELGQLDERWAIVIRLHFGLDGEDALTLERIGKRLAIRKQRVRQIEVKALAAMRAG